MRQIVPSDETKGFPAKSVTDALPPADTELKYGFRAYIVDRTAKFCSTLVFCVTAVALLAILGWTIVETSRALAGRNTHVQSDLSARVQFEGAIKGEGDLQLSVPQLQPLADVFGSRNVAWGLMGTSVVVSLIFAIRARRRNRDNIRQFAPFRKRYEVEIDPKRSSANLTNDGDTPEDD